MRLNRQHKLYESIIKDVAKVVKRKLNEAETVNDDNHILVTYYFNSNNSENCYTNPNGDVNHIQLANKAFDIMDKYAQFMDLDESNNMKKIHEGDKSTLKIGWQFVTASPFDDIDSLINELKILNKYKSFIEIKIGNYYKTN